MSAAALIWLLGILLLLQDGRLPLRWHWGRACGSLPVWRLPAPLHGLEELTSPTPDWLRSEWARCPAAAEAGTAFQSGNGSVSAAALSGGASCHPLRFRPTARGLA